MKPPMTHDQRIRREAGSLFETSYGTKCVVITCTAESRCIRRYIHDLEQQRILPADYEISPQDGRSVTVGYILVGYARRSALGSPWMLRFSKIFTAIERIVADLNAKPMSDKLPEPGMLSFLEVVNEY